MNITMNHIFLLSLPAYHSAIPFQIADHIISNTNAAIYPDALLIFLKQGFKYFFKSIFVNKNMIKQIIFNGKELGHLTEEFGKSIFAATNLQSLENFFTLRPLNEIEIKEDSGSSRVTTYEQFKEEYFQDICGFYPSWEDYILKNQPVRTKKEYEHLYQNYL